MPEYDETPYDVDLGDNIPSSSDYARYVWSDVVKERLRQDGKFGVSRNLHPSFWLPILVEEVGEVAKALLKGDEMNYREEMVHVAAVALAALQDWDWQHSVSLPAPQVVPFAWERANGKV